jgi:uncharacterized membrane protein
MIDMKIYKLNILFDTNTIKGVLVDIVKLVLAIATAVGFAASLGGYVEYKRSLSGGSLICRAEEEKGCSALYMLPQAKLLGVVHLSEAAPIYFTIMLAGVAAFLLTGSTALLYLLIVLAIGGALLVPYLVYLEWLVRTLCIWCTIMHASIITDTAALAILAFR